MATTVRVGIVGAGLIGGSFGLALKAAGFDAQITVYGRDQANLNRVLERGIADEASTDISVLREVDVLLLAVPMLAMPTVLEAVSTVLSPECIITDAGSVKRSFVDDVQRLLPDRLPYIVPGHPIAGAETSGVESGFASLFQGRRVLLTPLESTTPEALSRVETLWQATGAVVESMSVEKHDRVLAATSHLPHMLAFGMADSLAHFQDRDNILRYAAGGFRDFTRIAASDPIMWRDICLTNKAPLVDVMDQLMSDFQQLRDAIDAGDSDYIEQTFKNARRIRLAYQDIIE